MCPTCPSVPEVTCISPSKAHLPTSATLAGPAHRSGIRPVIHRRPLGGVATSPVVSCRLSATGISFLGILFPLGLQLSSRSAYQAMPGPRRGSHVPHAQDSTGVGALCIPGRWCSPGWSTFSSRHPPPSQAASPLLRNPIPSDRRWTITGHHRGFTYFTRPAFPSPVVPGWDEDPWASPWASDPAVTHDARQDRDEP